VDQRSPKVGKLVKDVLKKASKKYLVPSAWELFFRRSRRVSTSRPQSVEDRSHAERGNEGQRH